MKYQKVIHNKRVKQIDTIKANVDIFLNLNPVEEQDKEQANERG